VSNAVEAEPVRLSDAKTSIGSLHFPRPHRRAQRELARALAQFLFDDEKLDDPHDMSESMEKHSGAAYRPRASPATLYTKRAGSSPKKSETSPVFVGLV